MSRTRLALDSLRRKIVFGYGAIAALVVALSAFSLIEMRLLEAQILAGERIGQFLGIALEIRRFEKNYFLYRQTADLDENRDYVAQARRLLTEHGALLETFEKSERIRALLDTLDAYAALMNAHSAAGDDVLREARIRHAGKEIVTAAEEWSRAERVILQAQLERHRRWLLGSIAAVVLLLLAIGHWLSWRVARPLKQLEDNMQAVAAGRLAKLEMATPDREIASLTQAFNHVLHELEQRQGQLVRSEKLAALGTLLSGVAHELNNPLSNISTSCEILAEEVGARKVGAGDTAFQRELLGQIDAETWRARRIVRSLLDYARDRKFHSETLQLAPLVAESLRLIKGQIPAQVSIETDIPAELAVSGDKQRLQQVLFNLVGNAVAALEGAGEVRIAARTTGAPFPADALPFGQSQRAGAAVEIEIRDNGHGIAPEILPRIFDPFFTTKDVGHGLGLGLFIVFEIIEEHSGCIAVRSTPGQGTSFLVRLPQPETAP
ncbi:MAG: ATP-binding protein [Sulfuritalea sp.]|nr:ATP-binding protein [Sulfuritalea sp.]